MTIDVVYVGSGVKAYVDDVLVRIRSRGGDLRPPKWVCFDPEHHDPTGGTWCEHLAVLDATELTPDQYEQIPDYRKAQAHERQAV